MTGAGGYPEGMRLAVGDVVVYPSHGGGSVVAREQRLVLGVVREVVVLDLVDGLTVTLPVEQAQKVLRPLLTKQDLQLVQKTLRESHSPAQETWLKRRKDAEVRMAGGDPLGLAQIVRDGALRQRSLRAKGNGSLLSAGERAIYTRARRLLSGEIGLANGLEPVEADAWIDQQLGVAA
jgi:CarD family transcriptional regulator